MSATFLLTKAPRGRCNTPSGCVAIRKKERKTERREKERRNDGRKEERKERRKAKSEHSALFRIECNIPPNQNAMDQKKRP